MSRKIEIKIETERVVVISHHSLQDWCDKCGRRVRLVRLASGALDDFEIERLFNAAASGKFHLTAALGGSFMICLNSLLENFNDEDRSPLPDN